jgi:hypothetical protein
MQRSACQTQWRVLGGVCAVECARITQPTDLRLADVATAGWVSQGSVVQTFSDSLTSRPVCALRFPLLLLLHLTTLRRIAPALPLDLQGVAQAVERFVAGRYIDFCTNSAITSEEMSGQQLLYHAPWDSIESYCIATVLVSKAPVCDCVHQQSTRATLALCST